MREEPFRVQRKTERKSAAPSQEQFISYSENDVTPSAGEPHKIFAHRFIRSGRVDSMRIDAAGVEGSLTAMVRVDRGRTNQEIRHTQRIKNGANGVSEIVIQPGDTLELFLVGSGSVEEVIFVGRYVY